MQSVWRLEFGVKKKKLRRIARTIKWEPSTLVFYMYHEKNKKDGWMGGKEVKEKKE